MVERYQASIVWIGRRPLNEAIERKLAGLAERARAVGARAPRYISADASDRESLLSAYRQIKEDYPRIDGVVHSAIVLADRTLTHMDEDVFRAALASKADVGVNIADVFGAEPLDFVLFFSSVESFARAAGQANYAAGCTFKDALAHELQQRGLPLVKAVNWGYWGVTGVVSDPFYQERMAAVGIDSLDPDEALNALESFLGSEHSQVVLMRTFDDEALRGLALDERQASHPAVLPSVRGEIVAAHRAPRGEVERLHAFLPHPRMCELAAQLLFVTLRDLAPRGAGQPESPDALDGLDQRVLAKYARWMRRATGCSPAPGSWSSWATAAASGRPPTVWTGPDCGGSGTPSATDGSPTRTSGRRPTWSSRACWLWPTSSPAPGRPPRSSSRAPPCHGSRESTGAIRSPTTSTTG